MLFTKVNRAVSSLQYQNSRTLSTAATGLAAKWFPNEPKEPQIKTAVPGPKTLDWIKEYEKHSCTLMTNFPIGFPVDHEKSIGCYISDIDGNQYLDVFNSIACLALGYNHPTLTKAAKSDQVGFQLASRLGIGVHPPKEYLDQVQKAFMDVAPKGLNRVYTQMCGSCANESAYKVAIIAYAQKKRGGMGEPATELELGSCM